MVADKSRSRSRVVHQPPAQLLSESAAAPVGVLGAPEFRISGRNITVLLRFFRVFARHAPI